MNNIDRWEFIYEYFNEFYVYSMTKIILKMFRLSWQSMKASSEESRYKRGIFHMYLITYTFM